MSAEPPKCRMSNERPEAKRSSDEIHQKQEKEHVPAAPAAPVAPAEPQNVSDQQGTGTNGSTSPGRSPRQGMSAERVKPQDSLPPQEDDKEHGKKSDRDSAMHVPADHAMHGVPDDVPADLKEIPTSDKDAMVDAMFMDIAKEKFYYGSVALEDLKELLVYDGDFVIRVSDTDPKSHEKAQAEIVVRQGMLWKSVPFKFLNIGNSGRTVTLNGSMGKKTIIELLSDHIRLSLPIDASGTRLLRAINRPIWQLKKENISMEKQIGEGAFGTVWKGHLAEEKGTRPVAIKITKVCEENKTKMEEMLVEARLMRQLQHPNVVGFYGMVNDGVEAMIVMELVNGGSLDNHLKKNIGKITVAQKMSYCFDVSYGLHYLHSRRMIHRDLAVRNCLIDTEQNIVKISDFGMSKQCDRYQIQANERTPIRWQAPEVIKTSIYTKECDVWSLGMVFFEIFGDAVPPFDGYDNKQIRTKIHDPSFRPKIAPCTPKPMQMILQSVWSAEPLKRMPLTKITQLLYKYSSRKNSKRSHVKKNSDASKRKLNPPSAQKKASGDNISLLNRKDNGSLLHKRDSASQLHKKDQKSQLNKKSQDKNKKMSGLVIRRCSSVAAKESGKKQKKSKVTSKGQSAKKGRR